MSEDLTSLGYTVLRGESMEPESLLEIASRFGTPELISEIAYAGNDKNPDVQFTRGSVPWHNERLYSSDSPAYLMLGCVLPSAKGTGRTLLLDGHLAANALKNLDARLENVVLRYSKNGRRRDWPLIMRHPSTGIQVIRYRQDPPGQSHIQVVEGPKSLDVERIVGLVGQALGSLGATYAHAWSAGDILIADNFRVMHGREAYSGERKLRRILIGARVQAQVAQGAYNGV